MKKYLLFAAMFTVAFGIAAQSKMDLGSRARLRGSVSGLTVAGAGENRTIRKAPGAGASVMHGFVTLAKGYDRSALDAVEGLSVTGGRGDILLVEATPAALAALDTLGAVVSVSIERPLAPKLDKARAVSHIDEIHSGLDLPQGYSGAGVVAGLVDGGFDPNHINFRKADGSSRISRFTYYRPTQSGQYVEEKYGADYIPNIDTEEEETYHGTHTLGIMAGSYRGNIKAATMPNAFTFNVEEMPNPYYGVAYGADLAVACGAMSDYYIAMGIESILDYAYEQKKPAVINLSLGSNVGPHDGSSTICQYIDAESDYDHVIFCISAGNEGDLPIALHKRFTADDLTVGSFLYPAIEMKDYQNVHYGQTYFYSDTEETFDVQAVIVNRARGVVAMRMPLAAGAGVQKYWVSSADYQAEESDIVSAQFARYFTGYVGLAAEYDETTGRYYAVLDCLTWDNTSGSNASGNYLLGFVVTGKDGQRIDIFNDGVYNNLSGYGIDGYSDGMTDGSISDVATGHTAVVVGSYNSREIWASLDKEPYHYGSFPEGAVSSFSSYGTLVDGRTKPDVCAPGNTVISSSNKYYIDKYELGDAELQATVEGDGRVYAWHQSMGTSMSAPLVAGSIALWLEACPDLTYKEVLEIIRETSVVDDDVLAAKEPVQWGAGKFNAYAGLKKALSMTSVTDVAVGDRRAAIAATGDRSFEVSLPGSGNIRVDVYDVTGRLVGTAAATSDSVTVDLAGIPAGVYLFNVNGAHTSRILVK